MAETKTTTDTKGATIKTAAPAATTPAATTPATTTPAATAPMSLTDRQKKIMQISSIGSSVGLVGGLVYAFRGKKGFWAYVGYGLLGSIIGGTVAGVGAKVLIKKD